MKTAVPDRTKKKELLDTLLDELGEECRQTLDLLAKLRGKRNEKVRRTACPSMTPFIVIGEALDGLGKQFVVVGKAMNHGLDAGTITKEQYRTWADFAKRFQTLYPSLAQGWRDARKATDVLAELSASIVHLHLHTKGMPDLIDDVFDREEDDES